MAAQSPEAVQYRFVVDKKSKGFRPELPPVLDPQRIQKENRKALKEWTDEFTRGENCPDKSIVDTRRGIDLGYDLPFAVMVVKQGEDERAYRYVDSVAAPKNGAVSIRDVPKDSLSAVENPIKVTFFPGIVIDTEATFGPDWNISKSVQQGGVVFEEKEKARGKYGVWEELEGNGEGAFRMVRKLPVAQNSL